MGLRIRPNRFAREAGGLPEASLILDRLAGKTMLLDCGHQVTLGHQGANTLIVHSYGYASPLKTECHNCGY